MHSAFGRMSSALKMGEREDESQVNGAVSMSDCLLSCSTSSAESAGCSGITDQICVCTSTAFHDAVSLCLTSRCPTSDYQNAQALYQEEC
ncbi:hypothetical protein V8B97DRAFT_506014 [Scleroderma yunnanense]